MGRVPRTLLAVAVAAAGAYFLDPARRARASDRLSPLLDGGKGAGPDDGGTSPRRSAEDDARVADAVRQRLAATDVDTTDVTVGCVDGVVSLRGQVRSLGVQGVVEVEASRTPGVREVKSWLHEPATTAPDVAATVQPEDTAPPVEPTG